VRLKNEEARLSTISNSLPPVSGGCVIGVTGGIACGKSEVGRILAGAGVVVRDADAIAHGVMEPGGAAYEAVRAHFGPEVLLADGRFDRRRLGARVFSDPAALADLNRLVHPEVRRIWRDWLSAQRAENAWAALIVPLLFEVGAEQEMDVVIGVVAPEDRVQARLQQRGFGPLDAARRIAAQWPVAEKLRRADHVIDNTGSLEDLERRTLDVLQSIVTKERAHHG
jgi:dephospho-CoA kinase